MSTFSSVSPIDLAHAPAAIRNGPTAAKQAYQVALSFERLLVDQLTKELAATATGSNGDTSGAGGGLMGKDPASSAYASMLPQTLTSSIMSGGGTGIAMQLAAALDPALRSKP
jgi:hypothetical protein